MKSVEPGHTGADTKNGLNEHTSCDTKVAGTEHDSSGPHQKPNGVDKSGVKSEGHPGSFRFR